jgi:hypothetical protein
MTSITRSHTEGDIHMAHMGTSVGLKQPATGFGRALLTGIVVLAIGVGLVAATSFLAAANRGVGVPTADHSYDQIETHRAGSAAFSLPQSAFPASARDYRSASQPEIAPATPVLAGGVRER